MGIRGGRNSSSTRRSRRTTTYFRQGYLPQWHSKETALALALFREGDGLRYIHSGYAFLSYYKILNLIKKNGDRQKRWIRKNLGSLDGDCAKRVAELSETEEDVAEYLYVSCRCAVAHAGTEPALNPDDIEDSLRLSRDLPVMRSLAVIIITEHFELKTDSQIFTEHKYELAGFGQSIGEELASTMKADGIVPRRQLKLPARVSIRQWCDKRYRSFEGLIPKVKGVRGGVATIECVTDDNLMRIPVYLDFANERLHVDLEGGYIKPEGGARSVEYSIDCHEFMKDLILNGEVEIFATDDDGCLGRKDANIPVNIDMAGTVKGMEHAIEGLRSLLAEMETQ
jgi:hypothetical protein